MGTKNRIRRWYCDNDEILLRYKYYLLLLIMEEFKKYIQNLLKTGKKGILEGNSGQVKEEETFLYDMASRLPENSTIFEIGFNAGHSSVSFLEGNKTCKVVSVDMGWHLYTKDCKNYIDNKYPGRHELLIGDSTIILPNYILLEPEPYNLIFIDGGHDYDIAKQDVINCKKLANKDTIVILDDVVFNVGDADWTFGPTKVWNEMINNNFIIPKGLLNPENGRGWAWYHYKF
jgi:predicted O-methyltransferase YrrM